MPSNIGRPIPIASGFTTSISRSISFARASNDTIVPLPITTMSKPNERVVVSAHYDSVPNSAGADDNGTGVAGVLEAARVLSKESHARTLVVACWDEEERGLIGSTAYVKRAQAAGDAIVLSLVFEMIGYRNTAPMSQKTDATLEAVFPDAAAQIAANDYRGDFAASLTLREQPAERREIDLADRRDFVRADADAGRTLAIEDAHHGLGIAVGLSVCAADSDDDQLHPAAVVALFVELPGEANVLADVPRVVEEDRVGIAGGVDLGLAADDVDEPVRAFAEHRFCELRRVVQGQRTRQLVTAGRERGPGGAHLICGAR